MRLYAHPQKQMKKPNYFNIYAFTHFTENYIQMMKTENFENPYEVYKKMSQFFFFTPMLSLIYLIFY